MHLVFRPEAQKEILDAMDWYEERAVGLGFEFARAIDVVIERIRRTPLTFPAFDGGFRHLMARKFPYSVIYRVTESEIVMCRASIIDVSQSVGSTTRKTVDFQIN